MKSGRQFITYILRCHDDTFYVGKTIDLPKRLRQHNGIIKGGAKYTKGRRPIKLVYFEEYNTNQEACLREYRLKELSHTEKAKLCRNHLSGTSD